MKKKLLSCVLSMVLLLGLFTGLELPALATASVTLSVADVQAYPGDTVVVDVSLNGETSGLQITLSYDPAVLTPEKIERGPQCPSGFMVETSDNLTIGSFAALSNTPKNETINGVVARYTYKVNPGAALGRSSLNVTKAIMSDAGTIFNATVSSHGSVTVISDLSDDATLSSLTISSGTLSPAFSSTKTDYTASVPNSVNSITVTAVPNHTGATVTSGNGAHVLAVGANAIPIVVTAEDGAATKTYLLIVTRAEDPVYSNVADLASLTISSGTLTPAFSASVTTYKATVRNDVSSITIAAAAVPGATISGDTGTKNLAVGVNTFTIKVTAEDGETTKNYVIVVTRNPSFPFTDVQEGDWFYEDVYYMWENGLMNGTSLTQFSPQVTLTRGMVVTVLYRMEQEPSVDGLSNPFSDVKASQYYTDALIWAADKGIVLGYGGSRFGPEDYVTREQFATILYRYQQFSGNIPPNVVENRNFADAGSISDYARESVQKLTMQNIIRGKNDNLFDPNGNATRAEFSAMLHRYLVAIEE